MGFFPCWKDPNKKPVLFTHALATKIMLITKLT